MKYLFSIFSFIKGIFEKKIDKDSCDKRKKIFFTNCMLRKEKEDVAKGGAWPRCGSLERWEAGKVRRPGPVSTSRTNYGRKEESLIRAAVPWEMGATSSRSFRIDALWGGDGGRGGEDDGNAFSQRSEKRRGLRLSGRKALQASTAERGSSFLQTRSESVYRGPRTFCGGKRENARRGTDAAAAGGKKRQASLRGYLPSKMVGPPGFEPGTCRL